MAGEHEDDGGELRATVRNQGAAITALATQVTEGFKAIQTTIADSHEKTDNRIRDLDARTTVKIESVAQGWQASSTQRNQSTLTILGMLLTGFIGIGGFLTGLAGIAFTAYTLMKAPVDLSFAEIKGNLAQAQVDVAANKKATDDKFENLRHETEAKAADTKAEFVPKDEIAKMASQVSINTATVITLQTQVATLMAYHEATSDRIDGLREDMKENRGESTLKAEFEAFRTSTIASMVRFNAYLDSLIAKPAFPCTDNGAGCQLGRGPFGLPLVGAAATATSPHE